jgi:hypothetical protein
VDRGHLRRQRPLLDVSVQHEIIGAGVVPDITGWS